MAYNPFVKKDTIDAIIRIAGKKIEGKIFSFRKSGCWIC